MLTARTGAATPLLPLLVTTLLLWLCTGPAEAGGRRRGSPDLYTVMNLTSDATPKQIKKMYQKWSRMLHPDITSWPKDVARERMMEITEAYEILGDEERREKYDTQGTMDIGTDANTEWKRSKLFDGTHDAFSFKDADAMRAAMDNKENWMILFWGKNYPECLEASVVWGKFATRMKGIINVGTVQCDDLMQLCRSFGMRSLPAIFALNEGRKERYTGRIEQQTLVDWAASNLLKLAANHISNYTAGMFGYSAEVKNALEVASPGASTSAGLFLSPKPRFTLAVPEVWELITFEYTDCMDCRIELSLAVETLQKYSPGTDVRVVRTDCKKKKNKDFCKLAPMDQRAWRVAYATRTFYYAPGSGAGEWAPIKSTPLTLDFLPTVSRQWSARDLTNFVFSQQDSAIIRLTARTFFKHVLHEVTAWAILFTTSNKKCVQCTQYHADWEIMARITQGYVSPKGTKLRVASIDCAEHEAFCSSLGMGGQLPALRLWRGGVAAKEQDPHVIGVMDPPSMLRECKREMEPLTLVNLDSKLYAKLVQNKTGEATGPNNWFILYNAGSWCPPCNQIRQPWKEATRILDESSIGGKIKIGQVDCDVHGDLCGSLGIESYPSMHLHLQGRKGYLDFQGNRNAKPMADWVDQHIDNYVINFSPSKLKDMTSRRTEPVLVTFSAGEWCPPCMAIKPVWKQLANKLHPLKVGTIDCDNNRDTCHQFGIRGYPLIALYPNGPDKRRRVLVYDGDKLNPSAVMKWVKEKLEPTGFSFYPRPQ